MDACKITIHVVSSLDGMIAKKDNNVSWFETSCDYEMGVVAEDAAEFMKTIDCFVMGSRTYELAFELSKNYGWPYGDVPTIVLTHRELPIERDSVEFYSGDLNRLVIERLKPKCKIVWVVGGAELIREFLRLELADEIRLSILPIILGEGLALFDQFGKDQALNLTNVTAYRTGMVELVYEVRKP